MKYYGRIGFVDTVEDPADSGIWVEQATERNYYGDIIRLTRRWETADKLNDNLQVSNEISIISDPFANDNFHKMRYIEWMGTLWKITSVEVQYPRLTLSIGGVYNGVTPVTPDNSGDDSGEQECILPTSGD